MFSTEKKTNFFLLKSYKMLSSVPRNGQIEETLRYIYIFFNLKKNKIGGMPTKKIKMQQNM